MAGLVFLPYRNQRLAPALVALAILLLIAASGARAGAQLTSAEGFVQQFADRAIAMIAGSDVPGQRREDVVRRILTDGFDMPIIGRAVLGRHWRTATDLQRSAYLAVFEDYLVATYARRLNEYRGQRLSVAAARPVGRDDLLVTSQIDGGNGIVPVDWRVRQATQGWRIIDVVIAGVSMAFTQRSEFAAVIERGGGDIDALLDALREKTQAIRVASAS